MEEINWMLIDSLVHHIMDDSECFVVQLLDIETEISAGEEFVGILIYQQDLLSCMV